MKVDMICYQLEELPKGLAACGSLWRPMAGYGGLWHQMGAPQEAIGDIDAWRPEASMPRCKVGWVAGWLGGWVAGWLGWLLAGCCWLMQGSLPRSTLQEVSGFFVELQVPVRF